MSMTQVDHDSSKHIGASRDEPRRHPGAHRPRQAKEQRAIRDGAAQQGDSDGSAFARPLIAKALCRLRVGTCHWTYAWERQQRFSKRTSATGRRPAAVAHQETPLSDPRSTERLLIAVIEWRPECTPVRRWRPRLPATHGAPREGSSLPGARLKTEASGCMGLGTDLRSEPRFDHRLGGSPGAIEG